ncbi:MAG TPA: hypothetical protein VF503_22475 [Sphingobium sp.]|uniref:hypothetical protein n=1 Tax=Sphingobium sp. TaxID=1912891 RepID=UPI002ED41D0E
MLRTLIVAGIAAVAGHQLYKRGMLQRLGDDLKNRAEDLKGQAENLKRRAEEKLDSRQASHEAAGGPGGGPIRPIAVHDHKPTPAS